MRQKLGGVAKHACLHTDNARVGQGVPGTQGAAVDALQFTHVFKGILSATVQSVKLTDIVLYASFEPYHEITCFCHVRITKTLSDQCLCYSLPR